MVFNGGKFVPIRYGKDKDMKESTTYFSGETDEVIEELEEIRDLGIVMQNDASFTNQIEKASKKLDKMLDGFKEHSTVIKRGS